MIIQREVRPQLMKNGANKFDQLKIIKMAGEGLNAEEISQRLAIYPESVKRFMPKAAAPAKAAEPVEEVAEVTEKKPKKKAKAKAKKESKDA